MDTRTVTGTWLAPDGSPAVGAVSFTTSQPVALPDSNEQLAVISHTVTLDNLGAISVDLPVTDDGVPSGWSWVVEERFTGQVKQSWGFSLPAGNDPVDLADVSRTVTITPATAAYVVEGTAPVLDATNFTNLPTGGGSGDVVGPASATDNAFVRFDTTTGKLVQDSQTTEDDSGNVTTAGDVTVNGDVNVNTVGDAADSYIRINVDTGEAAGLVFQEEGFTRWNIRKEASTDALEVRRTNSGTLVLSVDQTTGDTTFEADVSVGGDLTIDRVGDATAAYPRIASDAGQYAAHIFRTGANTNRWIVGKNNTGETGSDAGSNYVFRRYDDAGSSLGTAFEIERATGDATFEADVNVGGDLDVTGATTMEGSLSLTGADLFINRNGDADEAYIRMRTDAGENSAIRHETGASLRWLVGKNSTVEAGSDVGSNYFIQRFSDAGSYLGSALEIERATGDATFEADVNVGGTLTANVTLSSEPTADTDAATKQYVDDNSSSTPFVKYSVETADSPYTVPSWGAFVEIHNHDGPIVLVLPEVAAGDVGKEIKIWVEHNPANHNVYLEAPNTSTTINNVAADGANVTKAAFNVSESNYFRITTQAVGVNEVYIDQPDAVYATQRFVADFTSTSDYSPFSYLQLSAIPSDFLTSNADWWFGVKVESPMTNDSDGQVLFGSNNAFVAVRGNGTYLQTNSTSGYLQALSPATIVEAGEWILYQYDESANTYTAWINGTKVLDATTNGVTMPSTAPTAMWFGSEDGQASGPSGYGYPLQQCQVGSLVIGSGLLSDADAALFTNSMYDPSGQTLNTATVTNQWTPAASDTITTNLGVVNLSLVGSNIHTQEQ